jgi:hypothetical protein
MFAGDDQAVPMDGRRLAQPVAHPHRKRAVVAHDDRRAEEALIEASRGGWSRAQEVRLARLCDEIEPTGRGRVQALRHGEPSPTTGRLGKGRASGRQRATRRQAPQEQTPVHRPALPRSLLHGSYHVGAATATWWRLASSTIRT